MASRIERIWFCPVTNMAGSLFGRSFVWLLREFARSSGSVGSPDGLVREITPVVKLKSRRIWLMIITENERFLEFRYTALAISGQLTMYSSRRNAWTLNMGYGVSKLFGNPPRQLLPSLMMGRTGL